MGRTASNPKSYTGVRPYHGKLQIIFTYQGKRHYPLYDALPTETNKKAAAELRNQVLRAIEENRFRFSDFFPNYRYAKKEPKVVTRSGDTVTFGFMKDRYLVKIEVDGKAPGTRRTYEQTLDYYFGNLYERPMEEIDYDFMMDHLAKIKGISEKTFNNVLTTLRGVFELWSSQSGKPNIGKLFSNRKHQKPKPDPFSIEETDKILSYMQEHFQERIYNYYAFAFFSGLRPGELIALRWSDLNEIDRTIKVERSRVMKQDQKHTKTYASRSVDLNDRAWDALMRQKKFSRLANGHIFTTRLGEAYTSADKLREKSWKVAVQAVGVRYRRHYNTRHTYATLNITANVNLYWLSRQMGHASVEMLLNRYSDWINKEQNKLEIKKVNAYLYGAKSA